MPHTCVLIPGDGIGPEVTSAARAVIEASGAPVEWVEGVAGASALEQGHADVLRAVFAAVRLARTSLGAKQFELMKAQDALAFRYREKDDPAPYASHLAAASQLYPPSDVVAGPHTVKRFDAALLGDTLGPQGLAGVGVVLAAVLISRLPPEQEGGG